MSLPILQRKMQAAPTLTIAQGPIQPWANDDEAEAYAADTKAFLLAKCAPFMGIEILHNNVLLATYFLPAFEELPSGGRFHRADVTNDEAMWQGKVGLVIAKGPLAFRDEPEANILFHGQTVEIGDWVSFNQGAGRQLTIRRIHCRLVKDTEMWGKPQDPKLVY